MPELILPFGGVSDLLGPEKQERETTRDAQNMRGVDSPSGAELISQRSGQVKHSSTALIAATKVSLLCDVVVDNPSNTYANLASAACTVEWSATTPNTSDVLATAYDALGNRYVLDGATGFVKYNSDGRKIAKVALPASSTSSLVRALAVDADGLIFLGESAGSDPKDARLWCYEQLEDDKIQLLWEIKPGWFTEELQVVGTTLYCAQNDTLLLRSRMAFYTGIATPTPTLSKEWPLLVYPCNGMHVSPKDGSVATCSEPNAQRGLFPRSTESSLPSVYWDPTKLDNYAQRGWAWWKADDIDGDGSMNSAYLDGQAIESLTDVTGNARDWLGHGADTMPIVKKTAFAGRDTLFFNGTTCSMSSASGVSIERVYRQLNRTALPCYTGAQFVLVMALRVTPETQRRGILSLPVDNLTTSSLGRYVYANVSCDNRMANNTSYANAFVYETTAGALAADRANGGNAGGAPAPHYQPQPGAFNEDGIVILAWVFDGGVDDAVSSPTRSTLWINGRPCDRWHSTTDHATLAASIFGQALLLNGNTAEISGGTVKRFQGDFLEAFVLCDWSTTSAGFTAAEAPQRLCTMPLYPDPPGWGANGDTELERLIGYMAHKWGAAHKLPGGRNDAFATDTWPAIASTVVVDGTTYTFVAPAALTTAGQVSRGTTAQEALVNLLHAMNGKGTPGTDYGSATAPHSTYLAVGVLTDGDANQPTLVIQSRDGVAAAAGAGASTSDTVGGTSAWLSGTTALNRNATQQATRGGFNSGHYPSPFFLYNVTKSGVQYSNGGPPNPRGVLGFNPYRDLTKPSGMLCKWDPNNGLLKNLLVSGGSFGSTVGFGGVGWGVRWNSVGDLYSIGPRQAAVGVIGADAVDVRKVIDYANEDAASGNRGFNVTRGTGATDAWEATPGVQTYHYPRMDVDRWDNLYVPLQGATAQTAAIYAKLAASNTAGTGADVLLLLVDITNDPAANCIAVDPVYPTFPTAYSKPRSERILLGLNRIAGTSTLGVIVVRIVSVTPSNVSPRTVTRLGVCGAALYKVVSAGAPVLVDAAAFDASARFVDSCEIQGKRVFIDGVVTKYYDPLENTLGFLRSRSAGQLPLRAKLCARYGNRLYLARFGDNPERIAGSKRGDMFGWDFDPQGETPIAVAAVRTDLTTGGDFSDICTGLAPFRDDLMYVFGDRSTFVQRGDLAQGGQFDLVVKGIGAAFGRAHCFTPDGRIWWLTNQAELYSMPLGGVSPVLASMHVQRRLSNAINFSTHRPELTYDPINRCVRIWLFPNGAGDTLVTHFAVNLDTGAWWPDRYGLAGVQPTAAFLADGDAPGDRVLLLGSRDGFVREESASAKSDDGTRIDSYVLVGPLQPQGENQEAIYSGLAIMLARAQDGARYEFYASDAPDDLGVAVASGRLDPGRNTPSARVSGSWVGVKITGPMALGRFAVHRVTMDARSVGMQRRRGH